MFLKKKGWEWLSNVQTNPSILRILHRLFTARVNIGVKYQDSVHAPYGAILVPELEFWHVDLDLEWRRLSGIIGGMLGDTSCYSTGDEGFCCLLPAGFARYTNRWRVTVLMTP